jgi:prepilin-type N-terminal cleavage/methylation domain-containing protein/prepilin-type processing-associated H-X9-DG protein
MNRVSSIRSCRCVRASPARLSRVLPPAQRGGLTLVELLAVIAIIGLLVGLLMPALQSARESSRLTTCTSNIKTLALASLSHLEHIGTFPSDGWPNAQDNTLVNANRGFNEDQGGGWLYNILPFMDLEALRNQSNSFTLCYGSSPPVLGCPTTFPPGAVVIVDGWQKRGATCYAGSMGSIDRLPPQTVVLPDGTTGHTTLLNNFPREQREVTYPRFVNYPHLVAGPTGNSGNYNNGIIGSVGRVRAAHVTDGLGNTLLCAERAIHNSNVLVMTNNMPCDAAGGSWVMNYGWTNLKTTRYSPRPFIQGMPVGCERSFGSRHNNTFAAAFCDGSVRQVGYEVDAVNVWQPLGSRNGREAVTLTW